MAEYIDREALKELVKKHFKLAIDAGMHSLDVVDTACAMTSLIDGVDKANVAEVRHGHWIDCEDEYSSYVRCSVCGDEYTNWEADCAYTDFCPGCGADMRGADNARTE